MGGFEGLAQSLTAKFAALLPHLDERQRRLALGVEAETLGHGGIGLVARCAGVRQATVSRGVHELRRGEAPLGRTRRAGAGRKPATVTDPGLLAALLALVEPDARGDPGSPLRWTTKSLRQLARALTAAGHRVSSDTVATLLRAQRFSLQATAKTREGARHPDRDAQFRHINDTARSHRDAGQPVISVDAKKKELVGAFAAGGREWQPTGTPVAVNTHDFPSLSEGKVVPYGVYDRATNTGWVSVGTDHDTAAFAVATIRRWWQQIGAGTYPHATRLLVTADAGGSNGYRTRAWKSELAALAAETGLAITVCHFPPGTSKWNAIEHRLFNHITLNWRGRPLTSHEVVIETIAATTTSTGLRVRAELDPARYPTGVQVSDERMAALPIAREAFHGDWNYTLYPSPDALPTTGDDARSAPVAIDRQRLARPQITGMSSQDLADLTEALHHLAQAQRDAQHHTDHNGVRPTPRPGHPPRLCHAEQVLATIAHLRQSISDDTLATLFDVSPATIRRAIRRTRALLHEHGTTIEPDPNPTRLVAPPTTPTT